jgi:choline dehydrogenase
MLAEKIADRIRGRAALARADVPYFVARGRPARRADRAMSNDDVARVR